MKRQRLHNAHVIDYRKLQAIRKRRYRSGVLNWYYVLPSCIRG